MGQAVLSIDGACSGRRATCAAVLSLDGKIVAEASRHLPEVDGYVLAAEIAAVALAGELLAGQNTCQEITLETDNPDVARVIEGRYRPPQMARIPPALLEAARELSRGRHMTFTLSPRNSTAGLRRADKLASDHLWRKRR
jgi:ribonuclease HI